MAQYQRFLSYLFEYEGDQKKENCGFAKIEIRGMLRKLRIAYVLLGKKSAGNRASTAKRCK